MDAYGIPKFFEFFPAVLASVADGEAKPIGAIRDEAIRRMGISEADRAVMLPSGKQGVADNRVGWACVYLRKAGLMTRTGRGMYAITPEGKRMQAEKGQSLSMDDLDQYESFRAFRYGTAAHPAPSEAAPPMVEVSPQDAMDAAFSQMNDDLADELLQTVMERSPRFFENLVVKLLLQMGYGGAFEGAGLAVGRSGDEGIDGVIREDKLGFSSIYIQAKRWDPAATVGRPEVQKFVGALAGQGAQKGLFITTASFTQEAQQYARRQQATKIVLVDGAKLAKLMIEYNVGVAAQNTYVIKRMDSDFFDEDNG